jgi:asparagine synthase (glutamine-hydrolysing)
LCGIAGFTHSKQPGLQASTLIEKMLSSLEHRGPDDKGVVSNNDLTFGHRRLAIIDPEGGIQPCSDSAGNILIFNGEIYGYKQIANNLSQQHIPLANHSDTEILFQLLKTVGIEKTLKQINGMFAFAYYEHKSRKIYLARDRFGEKPLFYALQNQQLIFGSEIKALRQHHALKSISLDPKQISTYLTLEYLPGICSGYEEIKKLLQGHWLCFDIDKKTIEIKRYYHFNLNNTHAYVDASTGQDEKINLIENALSESIKQRLIADVPVGVFLSGGLDSSLIASMARQHSSKINSYTIKMPDASFDESIYAERTAKYLGLNHTTVEISNNDIVTAFDTLSQKLDEPLADSSLIPSHLLCHFTTDKVKVALGGDGADELFAGYPNFKVQHFAHLIKYIPASLGQFLRAFLSKLPVSGQYMNYAFLLNQFSYGFGLPVEQQSVNFMSAIATDEQHKLWQKNFHGNINNDLNELLLNLKLLSNNNNRMNQLLYIFIQTYLANDILVKMDRASMYSSLEVRSPFLDNHLTEVVASLPCNDKIHFFTGKYLLKQLAKKHVPTHVIKRKKHGFGFPISNAIRTLFKERVEDTILDKSNPLMAYFEQQQIEKYWSQHLSFQQDHGKKLWALYVLMNIANT